MQRTFIKNLSEEFDSRLAGFGNGGSGLDDKQEYGNPANT